MASTIHELQDVFREVFGDDEIVLSDATTADDIDGWDSMMHINLIIAIEKRFGVRFAAAEISKTKGDDQNIGTLVETLNSKLPADDCRPRLATEVDVALMDLRLHHIGIAVRDVDAAASDYERRLGCRARGGSSTTRCRRRTSSFCDFRVTQY